MAHVLKKRTEEEAKQEDWPCWMCLNGNNIIDDPETSWRDGFCQRCRRENLEAKPSEFYLRKKAI